MGKKLTTTEWIELAMNLVFSILDEFHLVDYKGTRTKITLVCKKHGEYSVRPDTYLEGSRCNKCAMEERSKRKLEKNSEIYFTKDEHISIIAENDIKTFEDFCEFRKIWNSNNDKKLYQHKWKWSELSNFSPSQMLIYGRMSKMSLFVYSELDQRNIDFTVEKSYKDCLFKKNPLRYDYYLELNSQKIHIELDGEYHRMDETHRRFDPNVSKRDNIKTLYCKNNNYILFRYNNLDQLNNSFLTDLGIENLPKVKEINWSGDFDTEQKVIDSKFNPTLKAKLLLYLRSEGKCTLTDKEIIEKSNYYKRTLSDLKKQLVGSGFIKLDSDRHIYKSKTQDDYLKWSETFNNSEEILVMNIPNISKARLLILLRESGKCDYDDTKISELTNCYIVWRIINNYAQRGWIKKEKSGRQGKPFDESDKELIKKLTIEGRSQNEILSELGCIISKASRKNLRKHIGKLGFNPKSILVK